MGRGSRKLPFWGRDWLEGHKLSNGIIDGSDGIAKEKWRFIWGRIEGNNENKVVLEWKRVQPVSKDLNCGHRHDTIIITLHFL